jgi:hypothetical protein
MCALNRGAQHILAIVEVPDGARYSTPVVPRYVRGYEYREPSWAEYGVELSLNQLLSISEEPS